MNKEVYRHERVTRMYSAKLQSCLAVLVQYGLEAGWHVTVNVLEESGKNL